MRYFTFSFLLLVLLSGCLPKREYSPHLSYTVTEDEVRSRPSPFPPLSAEEKQQDWGKEYLIGEAFARELDFYQALTSFKRSQFLMPTILEQRHLEVSYEIVLAYYMSNKYQEALDAFDQSSLVSVNDSFPAYHDLVLILIDCFEKCGQKEKADLMLQRLNATAPATAFRLQISESLERADFAALSQLAQNPASPPSLEHFLHHYQKHQKSMSRAAVLNAILPGAGYWYVGQTASGVTALLLNGLFIAASYQFFHHGYVAAGAITTSLELGWYFGGIYGGAESAKFYNQRLYETAANPLMVHNRLFPLLMLQFGF